MTRFISSALSSINTIFAHKGVCVYEALAYCDMIMDIQPLFGKNVHKWKDNDEKTTKVKVLEFFFIYPLWCYFSSEGHAALDRNPGPGYNTLLL